jgi:hypothetical protein
MMVDKNAIVVICDVKRYLDITGTQGECANCIQEIFISDSTLKSANKNHPGHPILFYCFECGMEIFRKEDPTVVPFSQEQENEIIRNGYDPEQGMNFFKNLFKKEP